MRMPWETIVKTYREWLGTRSFSTVGDYAASFVKFIDSNRSLTPADQQVFAVGLESFRYITQSLKGKIKEEAAKHAPDGKALLPREYSRIAANVIVSHWEKVSPKLKPLPSLSRGFADRLARKYAKIIDEAAGEALPEIKLPAKAKTVLRTLVATAITSSNFGAPTGVVVAGFGEDDVFPSVKTIAPRFLALNRLVYRDEPSQSFRVGFESNREAGLLAFAQRDVVNSFLTGIHPDYLVAVQSGMSRILNGYAGAIIEHLTAIAPAQVAKLEAKLKSAGKEAEKAFMQSLKDKWQTDHINPLLDVIAVLPKDELAAMAAALVNLTAVKRKMSLKIETVGGPVDVAVISKGDGFVWISRKHYFKPELNQHFLDNYLKNEAQHVEKN